MIHSFLKDTFVPKVFFLLPFFALFYCCMYDCWRREREREREQDLSRFSFAIGKTRDVIFMSFLPRLRAIKLRIFPNIDEARLTGSLNYLCNRPGSNYREILISPENRL